MERTLNILAPTRYPWRFNSPRQSRHSISRRNFLPLNKISHKIEGVTAFNPLPLKSFDLIHAFNRIPIGTKPYIIGFESHLPRGFGIENTYLFREMSKSLAGDRCKGIVAISNYALGQCLRQHETFPWFDAIKEKIVVRYPNVDIPNTEDALCNDDLSVIRLVFVGNHFIRKGGLVALRIAELAHQRKLPISVDVVSSLEVGGKSWVDPLARNYFSKYMQLSNGLPNVTFHGTLANARVVELVKTSHFLLLPTVSDSFGFSTLEAMAQYTPVIATSQGALPEFVSDKQNGFLLPLDVDEYGEWIGVNGQDRTSDSYASFYDNTVALLAANTLRRIEEMANDKKAYSNMRSEARHTAQKLFSSNDANLFWDDFYMRAVVDVAYENSVISHPAGVLSKA